MPQAAGVKVSVRAMPVAGRVFAGIVASFVNLFVAEPQYTSKLTFDLYRNANRPSGELEKSTLLIIAVFLRLLSVAFPTNFNDLPCRDKPVL